MAIGERQRVRITDKLGGKTIHIVERATVLPGGALKLDFIYVGKYDNSSGYSGYYPDNKVGARVLAAGEWIEIEYIDDPTSFWEEQPVK